MKQFLAGLVLGLMTTGSAIAHVDSHLLIRPDGSLANLPAEFGPAKLKVSFSNATSGRPSISSVAFQLHGTQIELPSCVTSLLRSRSMKEVLVVGSWYHDEAILPYYLSITFFDPGYSRKKWANSGLKMLFDLRTGKVIDIRALVVEDKGRSVRGVELDLKAKCTLDEQARLNLPATNNQ